MDRMTSVWTVVLGALGLFLVMALVLLGRNVRDAARKGPTWQRRLVAATLACIAGLAAFAGWHEFSSWTNRKEPEGGKRTELPRGSVIWDQQTSDSATQRGCYLFVGLPVVPPRSPQPLETTCYIRIPPRVEPNPAPVQTSLARLRLKVVSIEAYARADRLDPAVIRRLLESIAEDVDMLSDPAKLRLLSPSEAADAWQTCELVREGLVTIDRLLGSQSSVDSRKGAAREAREQIEDVLSALSAAAGGVRAGLHGVGGHAVRCDENGRLHQRIAVGQRELPRGLV